MDSSQQNLPKRASQRQLRLYNVLVTIFMAFGSVSAGYAASIIATTLAQPSFVTYFALLQRGDGTELIATTNGLYFAGGTLGVLTVSYIADRWGRICAVTTASTINVLASALLAGSVHIGMFIAFRFVAGAGTFMLVAAIPLWITETAPADNRGILVDFHVVGILFGYALATLIGYAFFHLPPTDNWAWRGPFVVGCGPGIIHILSLMWLPESPRFLLMQGQSDQAEQTLKRLHTHEEASREFIQISSAVEAERNLDNSWSAILTKPAYRKRAIYIVVVTLGVQSSGVLVINNYGPTIYASLGYNVDAQFIRQIGWIILSLGGGLLSCFIIDRIPRPKLLSIGMITCSTCLIVLAALVSRYATSAESLASPNGAALRAAVAMMYLYILAFQLFMDGAMYAYMGEIFPNHIRAKGLVIAVATLTSINILWTQVAPTAFAAIGWKFYLCFIIPCWILGIAYWFLLPDTLRVPLEDVARLFGDHEETHVRHQPGSVKATGVPAKNRDQHEEVEEISEKV